MNLNQLVEICKDPERKERLKSVTKEQMADVLVLHASDLGSDHKNLRQGMETMVKEMQELRKTNEKMVVALEKMERLEMEMVSLKNDNEELRNQMAKQAEVIKQHQIFLE
jgi:methylthioribose-1-phosphate isomerase